jgi:hypothetical protein
VFLSKSGCYACEPKAPEGLVFVVALRALRIMGGET